MFLCHDSSFQKTISAFAFLRATITKASTLIYRTSTQQSINVPDEFGFLSPDIKEFGPGTLIKAKADLLNEALQTARTLEMGSQVLCAKCGA